MACCFLEIYIVSIVLVITLFVIGGILLQSRRRRRGALIGLIIGVLIAPVIVNIMVFDPPTESTPILKLVVGEY